MNARALRALPKLAGITAILCAAWAGARLTWTLSGTPSRPIAGTESRALTETGVAAPANIDAAIALAPFGTPAATGPRPGSVAQSSAGLVLQGVLLADDPKESQAIIKVAGGPAKAYLPGETVAGGAVVLRVEARAVILMVAGAEERLGFPLPGPGPGAGIATPNAAPAAAAAASPTPIDEVIVRARQRIAQNPRDLLNDLGAEAGDGGYRIGTNASAMTRRAGFKPGDLVTRVNGVPVGNIENDRQLFEEVVAAGNARVEIIRDGKTTILTFPLK